jgi:integrase/recombinase XerD
MRITETVRHYLVDLQVRGRTAVTVADYSRRLDDVVELLEKLCSISELEQVRVQHLRQCVQHMLTAKIEYVRGRRSDNGPLSPVTVRAYVRVIKAFFHWCYQEDLVSDDPSKRLVAPKVPTRVVPAFTEEHIEKMLATFDTSTPTGFRDYVIILLLLDTGMRLSELCGLDVDDVHEGFVKVFGKGRKEREIGVHPEVGKLLWKYMHKYRRPADPAEKALFIGHGKRLLVQGVQDVTKRVQQRSGLQGIKFSPHIFRHTFAKMYLEKGGELFKLSREMGHSSVQITSNVYLGDFSSAEARREHTAYSPISGIDLKKKKKRGKKRE